MKPPRARSDRGFILVVALWIMVIVTIAATAFAEKVSAALNMAQLARQNSQGAVDLASAKAEMLFRLATMSVTVEGMGRGNTAIALDNRPYRTVGGTMVALQDTRGLLNLNTAPDDRLDRFLGLFGIPAEQRNRMIDALRDYTDQDKLRRLNGAEEAEYSQRGLPPPTNHRLRTPEEAFQVLGWRDVPQLKNAPQFLQLVTAGVTIGLNPNTAPAEVLATFPGVTDPMAQALVNHRAQAPFINPFEFAAMAGLPGEATDMEIFVRAGQSLRVTQWVDGSGWGHRYTLTLTPFSKDGPWHIEFANRVALEAPASARPAASSRAGIPDLPTRSTARPDTGEIRVTR